MVDLPAQGSRLVDIQAYIKQELSERGFDNETVAQKFMLLIEEVGELAKAARRHANIKLENTATRTNLSEEFGDVLVLCLDLCNKLDINAEDALLDKEKKNKQRSWS